MNSSDLPVVELAGTLLVDRRGWVLLQERDEHAPVAPNQWGLVGGHVESGESLEAAAYRELAEETGSTHTFRLLMGSRRFAAARGVAKP